MQNLDARDFELPPSTVLQQVTSDHIAIVKIVKSRIIMKDGEKILQIANKIRKKLPYTTVSLRTTAPVCSKTEEFLKQNGIMIQKSLF